MAPKKLGTMRSSQPIEDQALTTAPKPPRMLSGVCAECGTTYPVQPNDGNENFQCPRCGPSMPIGVRDDASWTRQLPRRRWFRHIRIPFFLVQMTIIAATFLSFITLLMMYMGPRFPSRGESPDAQSVAGTPSASRLPMDPILQKPQEPGVEADDDQGEVAIIDVPDADDSLAAAADTGREHLDPQELLSEDRTLSRIPLVEGATSVREYTQQPYSYFDKEVVIQCRLVNIHNDVTGQVPHHFKMYGNGFRLEDADDERFVRLEVRDSENEPLDTVFALRDGPLEEELQWMMPGDWILMTGTMGYRKEGTIMVTGLIVMDITALHENTYDSADAGPKKFAER